MTEKDFRLIGARARIVLWRLTRKHKERDPAPHGVAAGPLPANLGHSRDIRRAASRSAELELKR